MTDEIEGYGTQVITTLPVTEWELITLLAGAEALLATAEGVELERAQALHAKVYALADEVDAI